MGVIMIPKTILIGAKIAINIAASNKITFLCFEKYKRLSAEFMIEFKWPNPIPYEKYPIRKEIPKILAVNFVVFILWVLIILYHKIQLSEFFIHWLKSRN